MFECDNLYKDNYNNKKNRMLVKLQKQGMVFIEINQGELNGNSIARLASEIYYVIKTYKKACKGIVINCNKLKPADKLSYILFEVMLYDLIFNHGYKIALYADCCVTKIDTEGMYDTTLNSHPQYCREVEKYKKKFAFSHSKYHFRRIITHEQSNGETISVLLGELKTFFLTSGIDQKETDALSNVITELVDNAGEHTSADCLVDIDITQKPYKKRGAGDQEFMSVNTVVLNLGNKCLNEDVRNKIKGHNFTKSNRYEMVEGAYNNHRELFEKNYNEEDFFNIVSFQDSISGRKDETTTGGTGLTHLIKSLETNADEHGCYVLSGNQGLFFFPELLEYNDENWLGFNKNRNFVSEAPNQKAVLRSQTYLRGTGYNFTLIYKKGGL